MELQMYKLIAPVKKEEKNESDSTRFNYNQRRKLEMQRRLGILSHKRGCLERDLRAINNALISLKKQLKTDSAFEKVSL